MDWLHVVLRIVHIGAGVVWVGGAALFFFKLEPTITKLGPDAEKFVEELVVQRKLPLYFAISSTLTVAGGIWLYWNATIGLQLIGTTSNIIFGIGGIAAIIAWAAGATLIPRALKQVAAVGQQMKTAGGPPTPELMGAMHAAQERLRQLGLFDLILLALAVLAMSVARYVG
jgi:uncharacterized membrane protein